jgi:hypothetical protein
MGRGIEMKRQTLLMVVILAFVVLVLLGVSLTLSYPARRAMVPANQQEVALGRFTLRIPKEFGGGRAYHDQAWEVREYPGGSLGQLRLATEPGDGASWEALCTKWFKLAAYPAGPTRFEADGFDWFFKEVPLFGRAAYALGKRGKQLRFVCFFEEGGVRHWIGLDTRNAATPQKDLFDGMLASLRLPDGTVPAAAFDEALEPIVRESGYRFVQPVGVILLFPVLAMGLILVIQLLVRWRAGRLPEGGGPFLFAAGGLELSLARPFQRKLTDCAVTLTTEKLTVHTFGTPFLTVPRKGLRVETGEAWLGLPYVKLELEKPPEFRKWGPFYRGLKGAPILRIYTQEAERLRALLQGA